MGDNTKKDEEFLENTFGNYDSQLSGDNTASSFDTKTAGDKKKKNSNKIIFIVVGIVAVLMAVYSFILPMFMGTPAPKNANNNNRNPNNAGTNGANTGVNNNTNTATAVKAPTPAPVNTAPVNTGIAPQAPTPTPAPAPAAPVSNDASAQVNNFLAQQNNMPPAPTVDTAPAPAVNLNLPQTPVINTPNGVEVKSVTVESTAVVPVAPSTPVESVTVNLPPTVVPAPAPAPTVLSPAVSTITTTTTAPGVSGDNAALLNEMKSFFGSQFADVRSDIGKFNQDLAKNSAATAALTDTVRDLEARLRKLEGKSAPARASIPAPATITLAPAAQPVNVPVKVQTTTVETTTVSKPVKRVAKPIRRVEPMERDSENVIVSKVERTERTERMDRRAARQDRAERMDRYNDETVIVNKSVRKVEAPVMEKVMPAYKIHSLYAGRVWIANPDNTQSNFSVGDRLPNGELIKDINMDKRAIITDRGTITAR